MSHLRLGIAGLGNVGAATVRLLRDNARLIESRAGRKITVTAVSARAKKDRGIDLSGITWHDDPVALARDENVDVVVELIGGAEGKAFDTVKTALELGKPVVTANKAMLALRGAEVAKLGGAIAFEAAVAGGIPVIKGLREGLAANDINAVYGILNGTCNFILSEMTATGRAFGDVLKEAQEKGYAEADPTFDVDGLDAAHKVAILSSLAFGGTPDAAVVETRGIRDVTPLDIKFARELGCTIKLLGIAKKTPRGIEQSVEPCLVPSDAPVASVNGALNAVYVDGNYSGKILFMGAGAGGDATASAVVADIIDVARGRAQSFGGGAGAQAAPTSGRTGSYYLRLIVLDQPGVIADVSAILRDENVSLESVLQHGRDPDAPVPVILTSHETSEAAMRAAVEKISKLKAVTEKPHLMRIEDFR